VQAVPEAGEDPTLPTVYQTFGKGGPGGADSANSADAPVPIDRKRRRRKSAAGSYVQLWNQDDKVKLSILMPVFNEEKTVEQAVNSVLSESYPCEIELIVVNDGSTDRTAGLLSQLKSDRLVVREHSTNQGKGAALLLAASEASGTHILPFDADLEYLPEDIPKLLQPIMLGRCNVVYGARLFGYNTMYHSYWYAVGNRVLTCLANVLFNAHITDLHTCLKLIPRSMLGQLSLREMRFGLDTEITAVLLKHGIRPYEIPISYFSRSHAQGKKITWLDAFACVRILVRVRLSRKDPTFRGESFQEERSGQDIAHGSRGLFVGDGKCEGVMPDGSEVSGWSQPRDELFGAQLARESHVGEA
jgi:dolichol-phosphate hexosyltransferase